MVTFMLAAIAFLRVDGYRKLAYRIRETPIEGTPHDAPDGRKRDGERRDSGQWAGAEEELRHGD
ncbi:hypothetical protein [Croceicoccus mobilis]|uniref:Uncharacterized protein n=1 Tax=Croceicoccus mobilis TaxID=1703339 RepID=A0A917DYH4_9SPHN|nr:hypothetical protein [Croceicoccus mobilis]GGD80901.1 hypothetical protein GCM10010990_33520 [Croceicoccus mobilis]